MAKTISYQQRSTYTGDQWLTSDQWPVTGQDSNPSSLISSSLFSFEINYFNPFVKTLIFLRMILFAWSFCFTSWLDSNIYKWSFRKT